MAKKPYYITTAIAYTSGKPHIGNTYEIVLADSIARYRREQGFDVRFQTGPTSMARRSSSRPRRPALRPRSLWTGWRRRSKGSGI